MRSKRLAIATVLGGAVATAFAIGVADAQPSRNPASASSPATPIDLTWNAPAGCSDSAAILKQVTALRRNRTGPAEHLVASADVQLDASGIWNLRIVTTFPDGTHGERQIQAESCKAAADVTASILALALTNRAQELAAAPIATTTSPIIDAGSSTAPATPARADASAPLPASIADAGATPSTDVADAGPGTARHESDDLPPPPSTSNARFHGYVGGFIGGTTGDLPSLGLGGGGLVGATYGTRSWAARLEGYADYFAFARARFATPGGSNFQLFSGGARTCLSFGGSISVGPCAAFELGSMRAQSFDVSRASSGNGFVANGFLGALGRLSLDKNRAFAIRTLLELGASFDRPEFVLDGVGTVHRPAPVIGRGTLGAELRF